MNANSASSQGKRLTFLGALVRGFGLGLISAVVFLAGFFARDALTLPAAARAQSEQFPLLAQAQSLLKEHYLRELPPATEQEYGAIRGLIATLGDRLTYFIDPPVAASESNVLAGQYGGIGVLVKRDEAGRFRLYPFRDGPAEKAGVRDGDILLKVNDAPVAPETGIDAVDQLLRGEVKADNGVKIEVRAPSESEQPRTYTILFATIEVPSVIWRKLPEEPKFAYIQILRFTSRTPQELDQAITELRGENNDGIAGVVLDMRNNPGGLLQESVAVASQFLPNNALVLIEVNKNGEKEYRSSGGGKLADVPIVIIVNGGTASAAELVAGALRDNNRAIVLGQKSYGKGTVQLIFQLLDKSSLHVTTAEFVPPNRNTLEGVGLEPDVPMIPDAAGRDVELGEAIRQLRDIVAAGG
ncbi:MAG: S41 family peptidase [Anaerolineae bacterium]